MRARTWRDCYRSMHDIRQSTGNQSVKQYQTAAIGFVGLVKEDMCYELCKPADVSARRMPCGLSHLVCFVRLVIVQDAVDIPGWVTFQGGSKRSKQNTRDFLSFRKQYPILQVEQIAIEQNDCEDMQAVAWASMRGFAADCVGPDSGMLCWTPEREPIRCNRGAFRSRNG